MSAKDIPTPQLFTDLQVTLTELFLIDLLVEKGYQGLSDFGERTSGNIRIRDYMKALMLERFTADEIADFLRVGFPRSVDLTAVIREPDL